MIWACCSCWMLFAFDMPFNHALHIWNATVAPYLSYFFFIFFIAVSFIFIPESLMFCLDCARFIFLHAYVSYPHDRGNLSLSSSFGGCFFLMNVCEPSFSICILLAVLHKYSVLFLFICYLFFVNFNMIKARIQTEFTMSLNHLFYFDVVFFGMCNFSAFKTSD